MATSSFIGRSDPGSNKSIPGALQDSGILSATDAVPPAPRVSGAEKVSLFARPPTVTAGPKAAIFNHGQSRSRVRRRYAQFTIFTQTWKGAGGGRERKLAAESDCCCWRRLLIVIKKVCLLEVVVGDGGRGRLILGGGGLE